MFGYVKTDLPYVYMKDTVLYKAMYCGLCKGIGNCCNQKARLVLNYDLTFLSLLLHNLLNKDVVVKKEHCIIHHLRKRPVAVPDKLTERVGALNVILAYYKLTDGVLDGEGGKLKKAFFKSAYKKAKIKEPILDNIVKNKYFALNEYEKSNGDSIDISADFFGTMMSEIGKEFLKDAFDENLSNLFYDLGKWIYLIDALDDFDKDKKSNNYNVFINAYRDINSKEQLIKEKGQDLSLVFGTVINRIVQSTDKLNFNFNHDLIDNILKRGIFSQTKIIMENQKCKKTTKY